MLNRRFGTCPMGSSSTGVCYIFSIAIARDLVTETQQPRCRLLTPAVAKQLVQAPITEPCAMPLQGNTGSLLTYYPLFVN